MSHPYPNHSTPPFDTPILSNHIAELRQIEKEGYELGIRRARNVFFWIAGLMFVSELWLAYMKDMLNFRIFVAAVVEAVLFVGIALLTYKKPFMAIIVGLLLLIGLRVLVIVYGTTNPFSGIILLVLFTIMLVRALPDARKWEQMGKEE